MTSDVKLSHYFLLIKVRLRRVLKTEIIPKTISEHHPFCETRKTSTIEYTLLQTVFILVKCFEI